MTIKQTHELMLTLWNSNWLACKGAASFTTSDMENIISALEKQIPKKANISIKGTTDFNTKTHCPTCHKMLTGINPHHCEECGQAIDWRK